MKMLNDLMCDYTLKLKPDDEVATYEKTQSTKATEESETSKDGHSFDNMDN